MIPKVPIGVGTVATLAAILGAVAAFLGEWASSGDPNTGLGGLVVALVGVLMGGRSAQAVKATVPAPLLEPVELVGPSPDLPRPTPPMPTDPPG